MAPSSAAEPALTALAAGLAPGLVPKVLGVDLEACTMLVRAFPADAREPCDADLAGVTAALARLQVASLGNREALAEAGAPDRRPGKARATIVAGRPHHLTADLVRDLDLLETLGLPAALVHGDLHRGNLARTHAGHVVAFDWSDACWAHPALDPAHLLRSVDDLAAARAWEAWLAVWHEAMPGLDVDLEDVRRLADTADRAHQALTARAIGASLEPGLGIGATGITTWLRDRLTSQA